jgi:hypothetical protein
MQPNPIPILVLMRRLVKTPNSPDGALTVDDKALLTVIFLNYRI